MASILGRMYYMTTVCDCEHWCVPASYFLWLSLSVCYFRLDALGDPFTFICSATNWRDDHRAKNLKVNRRKNQNKIINFWVLWLGAHYLAKGHHRPFTHVRRADEWMPTSNELFIIRHFFSLGRLLCAAVQTDRFYSPLRFCESATVTHLVSNNIMNNNNGNNRLFQRDSEVLWKRRNERRHESFYVPKNASKFKEKPEAGATLISNRHSYEHTLHLRARQR